MRLCSNRFFLCIFFFVLFLLLLSCRSQADIPYEIFGEMVLDEKYVSDEKESENLNLGAGIEFLFTNLSEKKIKDFTIVLFAFDEEGNSPFYNRNNLVFKFDEEVDSKESFLGEVGISDYMDVIPEEVYELEYIYVSQIEYDDGFVWRDSFGTESLVKDELLLK